MRGAGAHCGRGGGEEEVRVEAAGGAVGGDEVGDVAELLGGELDAVRRQRPRRLLSAEQLGPGGGEEGGVAGGGHAARDPADQHPGLLEELADGAEVEAGAPARPLRALEPEAGGGGLDVEPGREREGGGCGVGVVEHAPGEDVGPGGEAARGRPPEHVDLDPAGGEVAEQHRHRFPAMRKVGRVHDVAMAIVYLASSSLSGHVSGQILTVSGGMEGRVLYDPNEVDPRGA